MKYLAVFLWLFLLPVLLYSQKTIVKKRMYYKTEVVRESYEVLKKNKYIKHGKYHSYYESGKLKKAGMYEQNKKTGAWKMYSEEGAEQRIIDYEQGRKVADRKVGIWKEYLERGQVLKQYDYDKKEALKTNIHVEIPYPAKAREEGVEGVVEILVSVDEHCELTDLRVLKSVSKECDEVALESIRTLVELMKKYDLDNCDELNRQIPISFKLE